MLDHIQVMHALQKASKALFVDNSFALEQAQLVWLSMLADPALATKLHHAREHVWVPQWSGTLNTSIPIERYQKNYSVCAFDGSQIYPDRHQGTVCSLLNIGTALLSYGDKSSAHLSSTPHVIVPGQDDTGMRVELLDCRRQELELSSAVHHLNSASGKPYFLLFDGSLIFWHLETQELAVQQDFAARYMASLQAMYEHEVLCAWYISYSKSRELALLVRLAAVHFDVEALYADTRFNFLCDTQIANFFLPPSARTIVFMHESERASRYPEHLKPCFFYMHVGREIARVEIPQWIARDHDRVNAIAAMLLDQTAKGQGYPSAIAEAHEQAVVKGHDRDMFYHLVKKYSIDQQIAIALSPKTMKKRRMVI